MQLQHLFKNIFSFATTVISKNIQANTGTVKQYPGAGISNRQPVFKNQVTHVTVNGMPVFGHHAR